METSANDVPTWLHWVFPSISIIIIIIIIIIINLFRVGQKSTIAYNETNKNQHKVYI